MANAYRRARALPAIAALCLSLAACADKPSATPGDAASPSVTKTVDADLAAKVPDSVKADGKIFIGTDSTYAPSEFLDTDGKTIIGFDVDLFDAVAAKLGLKTEWQTAKFDDIIPGVLSGRYEVGVSSFTINEERKRQVNMVSYFTAGTQWAVAKGNRSGIDPANACGRKVAVQSGTVQFDDLTARSKVCTDAGKPAIVIDQYQAQSDATDAVVTGKDDAMVSDSPICSYAVLATKGQLELLGNIYDSAPYGYVIPKDQLEFAEAVRGAVQALMTDGTYKAILTKWGVHGGAIVSSAVNP